MKTEFYEKKATLGGLHLHLKRAFAIGSRRLTAQISLPVLNETNACKQRALESTKKRERECGKGRNEVCRSW